MEALSVPDEEAKLQWGRDKNVSEMDICVF